MKPYLLALLLCGCDYEPDISGTIYVAPSARRHLPEIQEAVEGLNFLLDEEVFELREASSEKRINGAAIVRHADILPCDRFGCYIGLCSRSEKGVVIDLKEEARSIHAAHEMLHAIGLGHVDDPGNLMAPSPYAWRLTHAQIEKALNR